MAEKIITTEYSEEMQRSYMNYSMSVITARAIPDARLRFTSAARTVKEIWLASFNLISAGLALASLFRVPAFL